MKQERHHILIRRDSQMSTATTPKETALQVISRLPDDASPEEIIAELCLRRQVQQGLDELDRGQGITHDEVKQRLAKWLG